MPTLHGLCYLVSITFCDTATLGHFTYIDSVAMVAISLATLSKGVFLTIMQPFMQILGGASVLKIEAQVAISLIRRIFYMF